MTLDEAIAFIAVAVVVGLFVGVRLILAEMDANAKILLDAIQRRNGPPPSQRAPIGFRPAPRPSDAPRAMYAAHVVEIVYVPVGGAETERERERCQR